jgi:hypothetical protein
MAHRRPTASVAFLGGLNNKFLDVSSFRERSPARNRTSSMRRGMPAKAKLESGG